VDKGPIVTQGRQLLQLPPSLAIAFVLVPDQIIEPDPSVGTHRVVWQRTALRITLI
jgi:hypothetical protein